MISGLYAAIFMVASFLLAINVVKRRVSEKISLGDGQDDELQRRIRTHGNFMEIVPLFLILLVIAELSGAPFWSMHLFGLTMIVGRMLHARALLTDNIKLRPSGMMISFLALFGAAGMCVWTALPVLF